MECPNCRASVRDDARFCGTCGQALAVPRCPNCQSQVKPGHRFCARCGFELRGQVAPQPDPMPAVVPPAAMGKTAAGGITLAVPQAQPIDQPAVMALPPKPQPVAPKTQGKHSRVVPLIAVVTILLLAVVVAAAWQLTRNSPFPQQTVADDGVGAASVPVAAGQTGASGTLAEPDELWQRAQAALTGGDRAEAIRLMLALRSSNPEFEAEAVGARLVDLCSIQFQSAAETLSPELLPALDCLAQVQPDHPLVVQQESWRSLMEANGYVGAGQTAQALTILEPLASNMPSDFAGGRHLAMLYEAYLQQGDTLCESQELEAGRASYLKARALDPARLDAGNRLTDCQLPSPTPTTTPIPTSTPTSLPPGAMKAQYTQEGRLNVRMGPGFNYPIVGLVDAGSEFVIDGRTQDAKWLQSKDTNGQTIWLLAELIETNYPAGAAALVAETPLPPAEFVVADSVADFGPKQGDKRWFYAASRAPGDLSFDPIPLDGGWYRWTGGGRNPDMRLSAEGSYPSWNSDAMRMWVNYYQGMVRIEGRAYKERGAGYGGNGVVLRIVQRRPKSDQTDGFERALWYGTLDPYDTSGFTFAVEPFDVEPRDEIYFITAANGDDSKDNTVFTARVVLFNEGGVVLAATPTPEPTPTRPAPQPLCFEPRLRHFEEHRGCCGEVVGIAYTNEGRLSWGQVHIEGPPATDQYRRDFTVNRDGGYEITALTGYPGDIFYTIWLTGDRIRSDKYTVKFDDAQRIRAVVDFYQIPCK